MVITANGGVVGGQHLPLKATVDSAVKDTAVEVVLVAARTQTKVTMIPGRDLSLNEVNRVSDHHHINRFTSQFYLFSIGNVKGRSNLSSRGNG